MNKTYPYFISEQSVVLLKGASRYIAGRDHANFKKIVDRIKTGEFDNIERLFNIRDTLEKCFNVTIKNGNRVYYKTKEVNNAVSQRILNYVRDGLPYRGWVCFLNKLMENPSEHCRQQLFNYVNKHGIALCEDGFLYAYKAVKKDYFDWHTGKTHKYSIGKIVKMDRDKCETADNVGCGTGLHIADAKYLDKYYQKFEETKYLLCRFSPKDVMSVPTDENWEKIRVCKLRVMRELRRQDIVPLGDRHMGKNGRNIKSAQRDLKGRFCKA